MEAPFTVEPVGVVHIYNQEPGFLESQSARAGEKVEAGAPLIRLANPEIDLRVTEADVQLKAAQSEYDAYLLSGQVELAEVSLEKLNSARKHLALLKEQQSRLNIVAPASGTIVAPPRHPAPTIEQIRERLPQWSGTPLNERNVGSFLDAQTHVSSIAPSDRMQAVLVMDQTEREVLTLQRPVRIKFEGLPTMVWDGTIADISHRHLEYAPTGLSNQVQGPLVTVPDEQGRQKLSSVTYQAIVPLEGDPRLLRSGMRGTARVHLFDRSLGQWLWRYLQKMFQFRL